MEVRTPPFSDAPGSGLIFRIRGRLIPALTTVICATALTGCMLSVAPIIPHSQHLFEPRLLGTWELDDGTARALITKVTEDTYSIEYRDEGGVSHLGGRLGMLNERMIFDVWPVPGEQEVPETYAELMIQGHFPLVLELSDDQIHVSLFDPDTLMEAIKEGRIDVPYHASDERIVLRGDTDEVRGALSTYLAMQGRLSDEGTWRRVRD